MLLMWRQFTQWLGGMGIIVLALAVLPRLRVGGRQLLESELPGPEVDQLADRIRDDGPPALDPVRRADGRAGGRSSTLVGLLGVDDAMGAVPGRLGRVRNAPGRRLHAGQPLAWPTSRHRRSGRDRLHGARRRQLRPPLPRARPTPPATRARRRGAAPLPRLLALASIVLVVELWTEELASGEEAIRHGIFQAVSIMTTTGFSSVDYSHVDDARP